MTVKRISCHYINAVGVNNTFIFDIFDKHRYVFCHVMFYMPRCSWAFGIDVLMCKCKTSCLLWAHLGTRKTCMFVMYFPSKRLVYVLHVAIQYLLIECTEMSTFVNTYNRLKYIFDRVNSHSSQNTLLLLYETIWNQY